MSKRVYYAHHQWKYGTEIEKYELERIRDHFICDLCIFNPSTDMPAEAKTEDEIMAYCLNKVTNDTDVLIFTSMDGMIGIGVYKEVQAAIAAGVPVYYLFHEKFLTNQNFVLHPRYLNDRLYAYVYTFI